MKQFANHCARALMAIVAIVGSVLVAAPASAAGGPAATGVMGQGGSFTSGSSGNTNLKLNNPGGLAVDTVNHRMFAADTTNNRVVVYNLNTNNTVSTDAAVYVLGQTGFGTATSGLTATTMNGPRGLAYDSTNNRLYVADNANRRVLVFNVATITNGMSASYVIGQADFTSNAIANTQSGIQNAPGVALSGNNRYLFVADSSDRRVMVWDTTTLSNGMNASYVIGQTSFTAAAYTVTQSTMVGPYGLSVDTTLNRLYVSETGTNRITVFDLSALATGMNALYEIGQSGWTTSGSGLSQNQLSNPYSVSAANGKLFVADLNNQRVLAFDSSNTTNGQSAIAVYGQPDYVSSTANNGGISASSIAYPNAVLVDGSTYQFYVADSLNNRILSYPLAFASSNTYVLVDPTFAFTITNRSSACNGESNFATGAGSATAINLGHVSAGTNVSGGEALSVIGNSGGGFAVYVRGTQASQNLRGSIRNWNDVAGTYASPAVLGSGEVFGYTWLDSTTSSSVTAAGSAKFAALDTTNRTIMGSTSSASGSGCVSFDAQSAAGTPAGSYSGTVIYTAVPTF